MAPYLFLLVGEALHIAASKEQRLGRFQGIRLPECELYQLIAQHADDTSLSLRGREHDLKNMISFLQKFGRASGLCINWTKSILYWFSNLPRPDWTEALQLTWAPPKSLSKLLGAPFGISLATPDIDIVIMTSYIRRCPKSLHTGHLNTCP